jgi:hypothetical protein
MLQTYTTGRKSQKLNSSQLQDKKDNIFKEQKIGSLDNQSLKSEEFKISKNLDISSRLNSL